MDEVNKYGPVKGYFGTTRYGKANGGAEHCVRRISSMAYICCELDA